MTQQFFSSARIRRTIGSLLDPLMDEMVAKLFTEHQLTINQGFLRLFLDSQG
jgi:hypothetical protein